MHLASRSSSFVSGVLLMSMTLVSALFVPHFLSPDIKHLQAKVPQVRHGVSKNRGDKLSQSSKI